MTAPPPDALRLLRLPHLACATFLVLWLDGGAVSTPLVSLPSVVKVAVLGGWLMVAVARAPIMLETLVLRGWPLAVMLLVSLLYASEIALSGQNTQGFWYLLIAFTFGCFYLQPHLRLERLILMSVMLADFAITGLRTVVALQADPQLSRYLAATEKTRTAVYGHHSFAGLGGYNFAYSLAAILLILLYFLVRSRTKILLIAVIAVGLLVLGQMGFTTAIVLVLIIGGGFLVADLVKRPELRICLVAAAIMGWISGLYSAVLGWIATLAWVNADARQRLIELSRFLSDGSSAGSDLGARLVLWRRSADIFWSSGPLGVAGGGRPFQDTGAHSQWLDILASYGVWIGMLVLFLVLAWSFQRSRMTPSGVCALRRSWIFFLVLGAVNNLLFSTIVLTWMFLLPTLAEWLAQAAPRGSSSPRAAVPT